MENMMSTAKILWRNGPSGVLIKALGVSCFYFIRAGSQ